MGQFSVVRKFVDPKIDGLVLRLISKAALHQLTRIWGEEHASENVYFLSLDPGDMDTPLHAAAIPDADLSTLKQPADSARELVDAIVATLTTSNKSFAPANTILRFEGAIR